MIDFHPGEKVVDAIEEGKIVSVPEAYARREGLMILRKPKLGYTAQDLADRARQRPLENKEVKFGIDNFRKPLGWTKNQVVGELVDNFHWQVVSARKQRNMTRKQLADALHEHENSIKMVENGLIPSNDFILVNKIQDYFKINLRKDGRNFTQSPRSLVKQEEKIEAVVEPKESEELPGGDIQLLD
ncbi:helix-turn-helix domain-containing protein [Candidatus Pacearchaeota archaeon]|nr:helix-turn-helix domain-containing protein [Candidatus Pacearchaeota archaeon]